jgi:hypothetical protein
VDIDFETEKYVEIRLIQNDAESIFSLAKTERDPIFMLAILPYYALFVQSCQECLGGIYVDEKFADYIKGIRNYIKAYADSLGKSKKRISRVDTEQDQIYKSKLRFGFMKPWNIHYNLGTYWTEDKHMIGNTQMYADFLDIEKFDKNKADQRLYELGEELGKFIAAVQDGLKVSFSPINTKRNSAGVSVRFYYDLNTNKHNKMFVNENKDLNLFCMNLVSNINFVKYVLAQMFPDYNTWLFRVEYNVTYYTYKALCRLKNYCENNSDLGIDTAALSDVINLDTDIFQTNFRNCMMHYGIQGKKVVSKENIDQPLFGMIETCFFGMKFQTYYLKLRKLEDRMIDYLESYINKEKVTLQRL